MQFKKIGTAALIVAAAMIFVFSPTGASADYNGGGPIKAGKMCWRASNALDHGYWEKCPKPAKAMMKGKKAKKSKKAKKAAKPAKK